jgi:hypothetical protein
MYKTAFWVLIIATIISLYLQISGYQILETVIFLIVMDFIALWLYLEKRKSLAGIDSSVIIKIENLETACSRILEGIGSVSSVLTLEEKINKHREDINSMIEKINEKTLSLEEKLSSFGQNLSSPVESSSEEKEDYSLLE